MKMCAAIRYSLKPMAVGYAILFVCTALLRLMPTAINVTPVDMLFFFLAGALTFPRRTDILIQCGVSRERQYGVLWALCLLAVSASILDTALQSFGASIFSAAYDSAVNAVDYYRTWYTAAGSALLYGFISVLRNISALFAGHLAGILTYRFLHAGSRLQILLPCLLAGVAFLFRGRIIFSYALPAVGSAYTEIECIPVQFMDSPIRWTAYFFIQNFLFSPSAFGDSVLFAVAVPLFYTVILASLCCIFLRSLPIRRGSDA